MKTHNILIVCTLALHVQECMTAPNIPMLPFLRGGSSLANKKQAVPKHKQTQQRPKPNKLANLHQGAIMIGGKIHANADRQWNEMQANISQEWNKLTSNAPRLPPLPKLQNPLLVLFRRKRCRTNALDDVVWMFEPVLRGRDVDTDKLLRACRAHLVLMKTGGPSLRLVAKDLEANVKKAESVFKKSKEDVRSLSLLLELERRSGIHKGNNLKDPSAAVGLLWIRRSLAFQSELYASLIPSDGEHPRDSAMAAYSKHIKPFHGWALRKIFPASLSQMPEREVFIAKFGGVKLEDLEEAHEKEVVRQLKTLVETWEPLLKTWERVFEDMDMEDTRRV